MEQNTLLHAVFIDFKKAFDTVFREALWTVLQKLRCTDKVIHLLKSFHVRIKANILLK